MSANASNDDVIVKMLFDIDDVQTTASQVEKIFKSLSDNSTAAFQGVNDSLKTLSTSITETKTAFTSMATEIAAITGANLKANAASLETAKAARQAAAEIKLHARAQKDLADAALTAAQTEITQNKAVIASIEAKTTALKAAAAAQKEVATGPTPLQRVIDQNSRYQTRYDQMPWQENSVEADRIYAPLFDQAEQNSFKEQAQYARALRMEIERLGGVTKATKLGLIDQADLDFLNVYEQKVKAMPTFWDRTTLSFGRHIVQFGMFSAALGTAMAAYEALHESITRASEAQEQMVQLQSVQRIDKAAGIPLGAASPGEVMSEAGNLAAKWGDNINDVVQDVTQWYKVTGDLNNALFLTDNALKFQAASGTDLEDTYRTLIGLASQMQGVQMGNGDKDPFDLSKTPEILNDIFTAASAAGAGMRQVNIQGAEIGKGTANSAEILLHAFEQDGEALKKLGVNMADAVALNQSLITAMGNTGGEADSAAEKVSRLVGGIMELSKSSKVNTLAKDMGAGQFEKIRTALNSGNSDGQFLERFAAAYEKLDQHAKNVLDTTIAGNRQYGIEGNMVDAIFHTFEKIRKAEEDKGALDQTAEQMMETFNMQAKQLQGLWSAIAVTIGGPLIAALTAAVRLAGEFLNSVGLIASFAGDQAGGNAQFRADLKAKFGYNPPEEVVHSYSAGSAFMEGHEKVQRLPGHINEADAMRHILAQALAQHAPQMDDHARAVALGILNNPNYTYQSGLTTLATTLNTKDNQPLIHTLFGNKLDDVGGVSVAERMFYIQHPDALAWDRSKKGMFPPGPGDGGGPSVPGASDTSNKPLKDYEIASQQLADLKDAYADVNSELKDFNTTLESGVSSQERQLRTFGYTTKGVQELDNAHRSYMASLHNTNETLENEIPAYQKAEQSAIAHAKAVGVNTEEGRGWMAVARSAASEIRSLGSEITNNSKAWQEHQDAIAADAKALYDYESRNIERSYNTSSRELNRSYARGRSSLDDQASLENTRHLEEDSALYKRVASDKKNYGRISYDTAQAIADETDKHRANIDAIMDEAQALRDNMTDKIAESQTKLFDGYTKLAGLTKERATALKDEAQLTQDEVKFTVEYQKTLTQAGEALKPLVQYWGQVEEAQLAVNRAATEYADKVAEIEAKPLWQGLQAGLQNLASDMGTAVTDQMFGITSDNNQIAAINNQIAALQNKKTIQDQYYNNELWHSAQEEAHHKTFLYDIDEEIKRLQQRAQAIKQGESEHGMLYKAAEAMTKTVVNDLMRQFETNIEKSIMNMFVKNPLQEEANKALKDYTTATNTTQRQNMQLYSEATNKIIQPMGDLTSALNGSGSDGVPLASAMEDLAQALDSATSQSGGYGGVINPGGNPYSAISAGTSLFGAPASYDMSGIGQVALWANNASGGSSGGGGFLGGMLSFLSGSGTGLSLPGVAAIAGITMAGARPGGGLGSLAGSAIGAVGAGIGLNMLLGGGMGLLGTGGLLPVMLANPEIFLPIMALGAIAGGMFGPHLNAHNNPDIFQQGTWGQDLANMVGNGYASGVNSSWISNGQPFTEDPTLAGELGNQGELMFISNWIKANPQQAQKVLTPTQIAEFSNLTNVTANGGPIAGGKNGNLTLSNGQTFYWTDLANAANDATQAILNLKNATSSTTQAIVSLNMFGGSQGFYPYNYEIPGYEFDPKLYQPGSSPSSPTTGGPGGTTPGTQPPPSYGGGQNPVTGGGGGVRSPQSSYVYTVPNITQQTPIVVSGNLQVTTNIDGRTAARSNQAYVLRSQAAGYQRVI